MESICEDILDLCGVSEAVRPENKLMQDFLKKNGIKATAKFLFTGSLKGNWRLFGKGQKWTDSLIKKLTDLGFIGFDGDPLGKFSGNGGLFSIFTRNNKLTKEFVKR